MTAARAKLVLALAAALALAAGVASHLLASSSPRPIAWQDLSPRLAGIELPDPARRIFKVPRAFRDFQRQTMPGVRPRRLPIDYTRQELILVAPGPRSSTGYGVRIVSVSERRGRIIVTAREVSPHLGQRVEARVTYPFRLIAIPRSSKPVSISWTG